MSHLPETKEDYSSKIPAIKTLMALGWQYVSQAECLQKPKEIIKKQRKGGQYDRRQ